jgi:hypothetical protein
MIGSKTMGVQSLASSSTIAASLERLDTGPAFVISGCFRDCLPRSAPVMDVSGQIDPSGILVGHASNHLVFRCIMIVGRVVSFWRHNSNKGCCNITLLLSLCVDSKNQFQGGGRK